MPGTAWPVTGSPPDSSWNLVLALVLMPPETNFDTSTAIRLRSPSRSPPDASCAPFPTRSRQRSSANAAVDGLTPPPEERRRRATTFIFHAAAHRSRFPTYIPASPLRAWHTHDQCLGAAGGGRAGRPGTAGRGRGHALEDAGGGEGGYRAGRPGPSGGGPRPGPPRLPPCQQQRDDGDADEMCGELGCAHRAATCLPDDSEARPVPYQDNRPQPLVKPQPCGCGQLTFQAVPFPSRSASWFRRRPPTAHALPAETTATPKRAAPPRGAGAGHPRPGRCRSTARSGSW